MTQKQKGFSILIGLGVLLIMGLFMMNIKNENTDLKHKVKEYEENKQQDLIETRTNEEEKIKKQDEKDLNQNVVDTQLESDTTTFINKMFNVQNDSNYPVVKESLSKVSTQDFMSKYFSADKPQYNYNYETNVTGIQIYLNTRQDDQETMKGLATFNRFVGASKEVGSTEDTEEQMTIEITYKKEDGKWFIDQFDIKGQTPFEDLETEKE